MTLAPFPAVLIGLAVSVQEPVPAPDAAAPPAAAPAPETPAPAAMPTPAPAFTPGSAEAGVPVAPAPAATPPPSGATAPEPTPGPVAAPASAPGQPPQFDFGGRTVEPLPPPPAPVDPSTIKLDPWRGRFWFAPRLTLTGPIGGDKPARPTLLTIGGGLDFGVRLGNYFGLGLGISGQIHTSVRATVPGTGEQQTRNGGMLFVDPLFARVYFLKKRFQPLIEVGAGYARARMPLGQNLHGAQIRAGVGFDGWISNQVTIGFTTVYRMIALRMPQDGITPPHWSVGHALQGALQLGLHW